MTADSVVVSGRSWTGGTFSLVRMLTAVIVGGALSMGAYGNVDAPITKAVELGLQKELVVGLALVGSCLLFVGMATRLCCVVLAALWLMVFGVSPALPFTPVHLLLMALVHPTPYLSWPARTRDDPAGDFVVTSHVPKFAWAAIFAAYLQNLYVIPNTTSFIGAASVFFICAAAFTSPFLRKWLWSLSFSVQAAIAHELIHVPTATGLLYASPTLPPSSLVGLLLIHSLAMDPAWFEPVAPGTQDRLFYDGDCGLCHRFLRFVMSEDLTNSVAVFTPLQSDICERVLAEHLKGKERTTIPDSVLVYTQDGELLMRSEAALYVMTRLGGVWRVLGEIGLLFPLIVRDTVYNTIAKFRRNIFAKPESGACPMLPKRYRGRFELGELI